MSHDGSDSSVDSGIHSADYDGTEAVSSFVVFDDVGNHMTGQN